MAGFSVINKNDLYYLSTTYTECVVDDMYNPLKLFFKDTQLCVNKIYCKFTYDEKHRMNSCVISQVDGSNQLFEVTLKLPVKFSANFEYDDEGQIIRYEDNNGNWYDANLMTTPFGWAKPWEDVLQFFVDEYNSDICLLRGPFTPYVIDNSAPVERRYYWIFKRVIDKLEQFNRGELESPFI